MKILRNKKFITIIAIILGLMIVIFNLLFSIMFYKLYRFDHCKNIDFSTSYCKKYKNF